MPERIQVAIGGRKVNLPVLESPEITRAAAVRVEAHLAAVEQAAQRMDTIGFVYETACHFAEIAMGLEQENARLRDAQRNGEAALEAEVAQALAALSARIAALGGNAPGISKE